MLLFQIILLTMLPPFMFVTFHLTSYALGLLLSSIIVIMLNYNYIKSFKVSKRQFKLVVIIFFVLTTVVLVNFFFSKELKPVFSLLALPFTILGAYTLLIRISCVNIDKLKIILGQYIFIMLSLLLLSNIYSIDLFGYSSYGKSIFPFPEPSHFTLSLNLFSVLLSFLLPPLYIFLLGILYISIGLTIDSLTLVISSLMIFFIMLLHLNKKKSVVVVLVIGLLTPSIIGYVNSSDYIASRLNFEESKNLSVLVYLQGWELMFNNFPLNYAQGIGFQMLGLKGTIYGDMTSTIATLTNGNSLNIADGGFTAAKIISEFGLIGLFLIFIYVVYNIVFLFNVKKRINSIHYIIYSSIIFASFLELFVRGISYFSITFMLLLSSVLILFKKSKKSYNEI